MTIPTPKLPFELRVNCILTTSVQTKLEACLHYSKDQTIYRNYPGINEPMQRVHLRLVNPKSLPDDVLVGSRLLAAITDNNTGISTNHILVLTKIIQSQWKEATAAYGAVLKGFLIQENRSTEQVETDKPFGNDIPADANPFDV